MGNKYEETSLVKLQISYGYLKGYMGVCRGNKPLLGALSVALESIDMRIPAKPIVKPMHEYAPEYGEKVLCPRCGEVLYEHKSRLPKTYSVYTCGAACERISYFGPVTRCRCGQVLDWEDNK